jgi:hypothetical protein
MLSRFLALLLILCSAALSVEGATLAPLRGRTVAITDRDTIKVLTADKQLIRVRLGLY